MQRRAFIGSGAALLAASLRPLRLIAAPGGRLFSFDDALKIATINGLSISPSGRYQALHVSRALAEGPPYGPRVTGPFRSDIRLSVDGDQFESIVPAGYQGWSPGFSPGESFLAVLIARDRAEANIGVWDLERGVLSVLEGVSVDPLAVFGNGNDEAGAPFAWLWDGEILAVGAPGSRASLSIESIRRRSAEDRASGRRSVREWSMASPTCGSDHSLIRINVTSGERRSVLHGDVRGVSLSPDRRYAAVIRAARHLPVTPGSQEWPPGSSNTIDTLVALELAVVDLSLDRVIGVVSDLGAVGAVPSWRLPVWRSDSKAFAVPCRSVFPARPAAGADAVTIVEVEPFSHDRIAAESPLDAELLTHLHAASVRDDFWRRAEHRPKLATAAGAVGRAVSYGDHVALWVPGKLHLLGTGESSRILEIGMPDENGITNTSDGLEFVVPDGAGWNRYAVRGPEVRCSRVRYPSGKAVFFGFAKPSAREVVVAEEDDGTFLWVAAAGSLKRSKTVLNEHLRDVRKPKQEWVQFTDRRGERTAGVLIAPTKPTAARAFPVVVYAYPNFRPELDGVLARMNSQQSWLSPLQLLLASGIGVYWAPLRMPPPSGTNPVVEAALDVVHAIEALRGRDDVDLSKLGFYGHSFGGYVALCLEARTRIFRAIVCASGFPDLLYATLLPWEGFRGLECANYIVQSNRRFFEDQSKPFHVTEGIDQSTRQFLQISPLHNMSNASTPLLLLQGEIDNCPSCVEATYSLLHSRGVPVELAFYWNEEHVLESPGNLRDAFERTLRWFERWFS